MTLLLTTIGLLILFGSIGRVLTADAEIDRYADQELREYPVVAADVIYKGALVGIDPAGYLKPFEVGDRFVGVAYEQVDNSTGAAAAKYCKVFTIGDFEYTLTSVALTDVGKAAYATADNALSLTGHPDAYVGRIVNYVSSNTCIVRLKGPGEKAPGDGTCIDIDIDFAKILVANQDEATATLKIGGSSIKTAAVGAGLTAGTTGFLMDESTGELRMLIDNDNEAENLTVETPQVFNITKGVTFDATFKLEAAGGAATDDLDLGLAGLSGGITATERADMQAATAGFLNAVYHVDTNGLDLEVRTDDNATAGSETDTTVNLVLQTAKTVKIIVRPSGVVEWWVAGARVLSTTAFSIGASGLLAGIVNIEKSTGTGVPEIRIKRLRVAGAIA